MTVRTALSALVALAALLFSSTAWAHAHVSPPTALAQESQVFTLAVPTEKENATTTTIELTPPHGFSIDSFVPSPGWKRAVHGRTVSWSGGSTPTEEDSFFQFLAQAGKAGTYTFRVQQTYADGTVVNWSGTESSEDPAPTIEVKSSLGGGGTSTLAIVALVVGAVGILVGALALIAKGGRQLA